MVIPSHKLPVTHKLPMIFSLYREEDHSGVSGTGYVAYGCMFHDGTVAMRWDTNTSSTAIYASMEDVKNIHGHEGKTHIVWHPRGPQTIVSIDRES